MQPIPLFATLVIAVTLLSGCAQPLPCPSAAPSPTSASPADGAVFVGRGDPYAPGPLAVRRLTLERCEGGLPAPLLIFAPETAGTYPVVVFHHGFITRNTAYSEVLRHLAGHGFVVVAPQMYEPGLPALLGRPTAAEEAAAARELLAWLDGHLAAAVGVDADTGRLGLAGHSRGGKVAWLVLTGDPARAAALALVDPVDGTGGPLANQSRAVQGPAAFDVPTLVLGSGLGGSCAPEGDNHEVFFAAAPSPAWHVVVADAGHADMLDEEVAASAAAICATGPDRAGMRRLTAGLLTALFRGTLQGDARALEYLGPDAQFPRLVSVETRAAS